MKNLNKAIIAGVLALHVGVTTAAADVVVIVNRDNPITTLSKEDAKRIYLGKDKSFPNGEKVRAADQAEGNAARDKFYAAVVEKTDAQIKAYWSQLIFTGKGTPPDMIGGDSAVKKWVAEHKSGIGYVDASAVDGSVKVLMRLP